MKNANFGNETDRALAGRRSVWRGMLALGCALACAAAHCNAAGESGRERRLACGAFSALWLGAAS